MIKYINKYFPELKIQLNDAVKEEPLAQSIKSPRTMCLLFFNVDLPFDSDLQDVYLRLLKLFLLIKIKIIQEIFPLVSSRWPAWASSRHTKSKRSSWHQPKGSSWCGAQWTSNKPPSSSGRPERPAAESGSAGAPWVSSAGGKCLSGADGRQAGRAGEEAGGAEPYAGYGQSSGDRHILKT